MELFKPSIDWGHTLPDSLSWIALTSAISAVCVLVVLALLRLLTPLGPPVLVNHRRLFHRFAQRPGLGDARGAAVVGRGHRVRLTVLFSYQANDLNSSIQTAVQGMAIGIKAVKASGVHGFWMSIFLFSIMAALYIARCHARHLSDATLHRSVAGWLTDRLTGDWLEGRAYYRSRFIDNTIDNPDQRIQPDIDILTAGVGSTPNVPSNGTTACCCSAPCNRCCR